MKEGNHHKAHMRRKCGHSTDKLWGLSIQVGKACDEFFKSRGMPCEQWQAWSINRKTNKA